MRILKFVTSIVICFVVAFLGSVFTTPSIPTWYAQLNKPFFNPPSWIFAPVWTILYFLMAISLFMIWDKKLKSDKKEEAIKIFILQLILNLLWSLAFFGLHNPILALIIIIFLLFAILKMIKSFIKISRIAGKIQIPYLAWVSFASILNLAVVLLNH
jgi:translocator protein